MFRTMETFDIWPEIKATLSHMADKQLKPEEIVKQIGWFKQVSILHRQKQAEFSKRPTFEMLFKKYRDELPDIFSKVARFLLTRSCSQIPLLKQGQNKTVTLIKEQILYLYCSMLLCLIPRQQFDVSPHTQSKYNFLMDFSFILQDEEYKTTTVIEYLKKEIDNLDSYNQKFVVRRSSESRTIEQIVYENKDKPMSKLIFQDENASIEDYYGTLKADFANKFLGGGALMSGCVQEEIMFTNHPELFTTQLLCEVMKSNESILLCGFKKYFRNSGYGYEAAFGGWQTHKYAYDGSKMAREYITAIDAQPFGSRNERQQLSRKWIDRQLLKAYVGFNFKEEGVSAVTTGNWGCGAFGGDLRIKFLVQWVACSLVGLDMIYCPFGSSTVIRNELLFERLGGLKVGEVYRKLWEGGEAELGRKQGMDIYRAIGELI